MLTFRILSVTQLLVLLPFRKASSLNLEHRVHPCDVILADLIIANLACSDAALLYPEGADGKVYEEP
jgi:hypothetical protein